MSDRAKLWIVATAMTLAACALFDFVLWKPPLLVAMLFMSDYGREVGRRIR